MSAKNHAYQIWSLIYKVRNSSRIAFKYKFDCHSYVRASIHSNYVKAQIWNLRVHIQKIANSRKLLNGGLPKPCMLGDYCICGVRCQLSSGDDATTVGLLYVCAAHTPHPPALPADTGMSNVHCREDSTDISNTIHKTKLMALYRL